ncbi:ABC transporter permease [Sphingomonas prati]|uniref:ABC-2 type transport system permease protein n=1 Tax=Sphingomonas prati TaxID=1843237 RepID=A0A7W9F2V1_9SPHN|nr:ABC transporter permease [Sphingomonas prati]MBB5730788.1 ABC-2 type transport system permease protein [Sphingomonas prati]GGE96767.1 ABC transporter [Sphingomonas prati]
MTAAALPTGIWRREAVAELKRSWRLPQFLLPTVLTPAAFYALFTLAISRTPSPAVAAASLAGYGVFAAIGPALFGFGAGVAMEREQGLIELKRVSPLPADAFVAAKLVAALAATAAAIAIIYLAAILAGVRLSAGQWLLLIALHLASTLPFGLIGLGLGMRMSGKGAVAVANALFLGSAVLGGLWVPSTMLPGWMQAVGQFAPSYHLGQLARAIVGADTIGSPAVHLVVALAMTLAASGWAWTGWRRSPA